MTGSTTPAVNSLSAVTLHERLRAGTLAARADRPHADPPRARRRVREGDAWMLLNHLHVGTGTSDGTLDPDRALRRVLSQLLAEGEADEAPVARRQFAGPLLVVRSGPWPVLRGLLEVLKADPAAAPVTVLCHRRDAAALATLSDAVSLPVRPLFYPRFGPFHPDTLLRVITDAGPWATSIVLDGGRAATGRALEHVTQPISTLPGAKFVWNASRELRPLRSLRDLLGRERYALVRGLLRWRAALAD